MKIGFFGGCFNPPSNIHINIAKNVLKEFDLDKVIFVPVGNYYKKDEIIDERHRYNMLEIAVNNEQKLEVENITLKSDKRLFATDTFSLLIEKYSNDDMFFIMGSDNYRNMPNWKNYNELINNYKFIVIERERKAIRNDSIENVFCYIPEKIETIDSTQIRKLIRENKDVSQYLNINVYKYIKTNNLY